MAFGLNVARELAHGQLYAHDIPTWIYVRAAAVEAALILGAVLLARRWGRGFWAVLVGSLLVVAVDIELWALSIDRRPITGSMPTVRPIGVSPSCSCP